MSVEPKRINDINMLKEPAKTACNLFMSEAKKRGIPIFIVETLRLAERQNWLYKNKPGSTQLDGYKKISNHQPGYAWDIACLGPILYDKNIMDRAGALGLEMGITWGGSWGWDSPHFEVSKAWKPKVLNPILQNIKIKLNGEVKQVAAINKNNQNYVKVRDLADSKISVSYTNNKVFINGYHFTGEQINLDGHNYIKLRDLPAAIKVDFDKTLKIPTINV